MKKSLFILSLIFAANSAFSGNNAGYSLNIASEIAGNCEANNLQTTFSIDLADGYFLTGVVVKTGPDTYSYVGTVIYGSSLVGTISGSFQVATINGVETVIEDTVIETYSDDETEAIVKAKHDAVKNAIQNVR